MAAGALVSTRYSCGTVHLPSSALGAPSAYPRYAQVRMVKRSARAGGLPLTPVQSTKLPELSKRKMPHIGRTRAPENVC